VANINNYFLTNLSASAGISYDLKTNSLGSLTSPNSAIFNLAQMTSLLTTGKPKFGIFDNSSSFIPTFSNNNFYFTAGKVFYEAQLISIQSQTISSVSNNDYAGTKYFKFYFDYLDFVNFSNIFYANITAVAFNVITVDALPASNYLANISQVNLNGYIFNVLNIDSSTNKVTLSSDVQTANLAFVGDSVSFVLTPKLKFTSVTISSGSDPDFPIPNSAIIVGSCSVTVSGTSTLTYTYNSDYVSLYIPYPVYDNPSSLFPNVQAYNSFLNAVNNSFKSYQTLQNYDYETSIFDGFNNYTSAINTQGSSFDTFWHSQSFVPTSNYVYGLNFNGLQKFDFDTRYKDFCTLEKSLTLSRTFAIFRGDIYGGTQTVGQTLGVSNLTVSVENQVDNTNVSTLSNGTYSYGVSAVNAQGEYTPVYATSSNIFYNNKVLNFISWTTTTQLNFLFFHVYKSDYSISGFNNSRLTSPFQLTNYTLTDSFNGLQSIGESVGVSSFAFPIKLSSASSGIIGGLKFYPYFNLSAANQPDNAPLLGIQSCLIISGGVNYTQPTVTISGTGYGANISLTTNAQGTIIGANVISFGSGYSSVPTLIVSDSFGSNGSGASLTAVLSQLSVGIYTGSSTQPLGNAINSLGSIPVANITSNADPKVSPVLNSSFVGLSTNTNYWAVFKLNAPYSLTNNQKLNFLKSSGYTGSISTFNGSSWTNTSSNIQIYKMGFVDYGLSGTFVSSNGVYLTKDVAPVPARLRLYVPNLDLSSLSFNEIGTQFISQTGVSNTGLPIQNSITVYVKAFNSLTGITSVLSGNINRGTQRGMEILLGTENDVFDQVIEVNVQPNFSPIGTSVAFNYLPNTKTIQWTINDLFTVDTKP